jgi:tellurite methyltransferase
MRRLKDNRKNTDHIYENFYKTPEYFFGKEPSPIVYQLIRLAPPLKKLRVLEIGCGEGRNAVFLARNGYDVTAFDVSKTGIQKTKEWSGRLGLNINAFVADMKTFRIHKKFDVIFSTWTFQFLPEAFRKDVIANCQKHTKANGLNAFSVFVKKPYLKVPHHERNSRLWTSGELLNCYWNWQIEFCNEEVFNCECGGTPHKHAGNSVIARKISLKTGKGS